jgi:hypothetical protein
MDAVDKAVQIIKAGRHPAGDLSALEGLFDAGKFVLDEIT